MSIGDRIAGVRASAAGWWSAWKYVAILVLLLGGSVWLNVHQYVSGKVALATAPLKDRVSGLEQAQQQAAGLIADGQARERGLLDAMDAAATTARQAGSAYRAAAKQQPLPIQCAPGQPRMDATNRALGAQIPEKQP